MQKLFFKISLLGCIVLVAFGALFVVVNFGHVDAFYHKFTYPAKSFIIGNSRAAQAILPQELEPLMQRKNFEGPLLNYAFTVTHSPFGPAYLESIKRKLPPETKNGLFIMAVDPWSLTVTKTEQADKAKNLPENESFIGKLTLVNNSPNLTYLKEFYQKPFYRLFADNLVTIEKPHKNGWLELNVNMSEPVIKRRTAGKLEDYAKKATEEKLANVRMQSLQQTIAFLQQHGTVFLVRIPVAEEMLQIENSFIPDFDARMQQIAESQQIPYLNYSNLHSQFKTIDGNHLYKTSGQKFTQILAQDLAKQAVK